MDARTEHQAALSSGTGKETAFLLKGRRLGKDEMRGRALKNLGFFWLLAFITAPLPPIHWVTVPGFFIFGIVRAMKKLRTPEILFTQDLSCPECSKNFPLKEQDYKAELQITCPSCGYALKLSSESR